jgi:signal transduction histidine kinase
VRLLAAHGCGASGRHTGRAGAGLGLFIVKGIVEAHGGRAWAQARDEGGSCLCFTLPSSASNRQHPDEMIQR